MRVKVHTEIDAPRTTVWRALTDFEHAPDHISAIEKIEVLERPSDGLVGFKWRETRTMYGKTATEVMWITDVVENEQYDTRAESHGAIYTTRIHVDQHADSSTVTMMFEGRPVALGAKVAWGLMGWMFKSAIRKGLQSDLDDLKRSLETKTEKTH